MAACITVVKGKKVIATGSAMSDLAECKALAKKHGGVVLVAEGCAVHGNGPRRQTGPWVLQHQFYGGQWQCPGADDGDPPDEFATKAEAQREIEVMVRELGHDRSEWRVVPLSEVVQGNPTRAALRKVSPHLSQEMVEALAANGFDQVVRQSVDGVDATNGKGDTIQLDHVGNTEFEAQFVTPDGTYRYSRGYGGSYVKKLRGSNNYQPGNPAAAVRQLLTEPRSFHGVQGNGPRSHSAGHRVGQAARIVGRHAADFGRGVLAGVKGYPGGALAQNLSAAGFMLDHSDGRWWTKDEQFGVVIDPAGQFCTLLDGEGMPLLKMDASDVRHHLVAGGSSNQPWPQVRASLRGSVRGNPRGDSNYPKWVRDLVAEKIDWEGAGHYWLSEMRGNIGGGSLDLGHCKNVSELRYAIAQSVNQGDENTDWSDWSCQKA